jgi:hypothetical protein
MKSLTFIVIFVLIMLSCHAQEALDKKIIGEWSMEKVYESDKDMTDKHNPKHNRWIKFNEDGSFISDGDPFGRNTGKWKIDNQKSILFINSDVDDDDSEWKISFQGNETVWTGIGHPRKESTKLIHRKKDI